MKQSSIRIFANPMVGRTGLSNMLFCWARAETFCKRYDARMLSPQWVNVWRIGPLLRMERDKRYYFNMFSNSGYIEGWRRYWILHSFSHYSENKYNGEKQCVVDFQGMDDFFAPFLNEHAYIKNRLWAITTPAIKRRVESFCKEPFVGVHIRRGDFVTGGLHIPDEWYVSAIEKAVGLITGINSRVMVRVFTDAQPESLGWLIKEFPQIVIMPKASALHDLWLLSQSSVLVGTSRSTFSMWAVYLGQMPSFWHSCNTPPRMSLTNEVRIF